MFSKKEKEILLELLVNEQLKHLIPNNKFQSDKYVTLEKIKSKLKE